MPKEFLMPQLVEIGVLGRPHGIRGEIRVQYYAGSFDLLNGAVFLRAGSGPARPASIAGRRMHQGQPVIALEGVTDRTAAESLRGQALLIAEDRLPPAEGNEHYLHAIIGFSVKEKKSGAMLGVLDHVLFYGGQETWAILAENGSEILLPAIPDFVDAIDEASRLILVSPPEGLVELYTTGAR
ncbi:MAG: 16S rRNA processing protein RimM [Desulfovibrionaceae bacterium]|nr:16S rRNA processing protein RimM [Desulfovibrionaceae bacterium]